MKKTFIFILLLLVFGASSSFAADFVEITSDDNYAIYVDVASLEKRDDYVVAWIRWIPRGDPLKSQEEAYKTSVEYAMEFTACSLKGKQIQTLESITYGPNGKLVNRYSNPFNLSQYQEVIPATYGENIYSFVMYVYRNKEAEDAVNNAKIQSGTKIIHIADKDFYFPNDMPDGFIISAIIRKFHPEVNGFGYWITMMRHEEGKKRTEIPISEESTQQSFDIAKLRADMDKMDALNAQADKILDGSLNFKKTTISERLRSLDLDKSLWSIVIPGAIIASLISLLLLYVIQRKRKIVRNGTLMQKEEAYLEFVNTKNESQAKEISILEIPKGKEISNFKAALIAIGIIIGFGCFGLFLQVIFKPNGGILGSIVTGMPFFLIILLISQCFPKKLKLKARNKVFIFITIGIIFASLGGAVDVRSFFLRNSIQEELAENVADTALFYTALIYLGMNSIAIVLRFFVLRFVVLKKPLINFIISLVCTGIMVALCINPLGSYLAGELFYTWVYVLNVSDGVSSGINNPLSPSST